MIESGSIGLFAPDASLRMINGADFPGEVRAVLHELAGKRTAARKVGENLLVSVPVGKPGWMIWLFDKLPEDTGLPQLLKAVQEQSLKVMAEMAAGGAQQDAAKGAAAAFDNPAKDMLDACAAASVAPRKNRIPLFLGGLLGNGGYGVPIVARMRRGRARKFWYANKDHAAAADELRQILAARAKAGEGSITFDAGEVEGDGLDGALLCQKLGVGALHIQLPDPPTDGFALIATDPKTGAEQGLADAPALLDLLHRSRNPAGAGGPSWRRAVLWTLAIALVIFLAWPVPLRISSTGQSVAASAVSASLPTGAYMDETRVRPGDVVKAGDILAVFHSPELEQAKAEEELNEMVEQINAQDALAQGNYAEFQMADQRVQISRVRLEQIDSKIEQLTVRTPVDGIVTDALPAGMRGRFVQAGMSVAEVQDSRDYDMLIEVAGVDAPLIEPGQRGQVYFRGLSDEIYTIEVASKPVLREDPQTGNKYLEVRASIVDGDADKLLVGLSGFVKIEVGQEPNVVALSRYAVEYVRLFLWKYLGLHV